MRAELGYIWRKEELRRMDHGQILESCAVKAPLRITEVEVQVGWVKLWDVTLGVQHSPGVDVYVSSV